jgi:ketosteroid isomerase-like protein
VTTKTTLERTNRFLDAMEAANAGVIADLLDPDVTWTAHVSTSGGIEPEVVQGLEAFGARMMEIGGLMQSVRFADRRITVSADGATAFVQSIGNFTTKDNLAYRNVYVFRFDWADQRIIAWEEYANPIIILRTFPDQYRDLIDDFVSAVGVSAVTRP